MSAEWPSIADLLTDGPADVVVPRLRQADAIVILTGQGNYEAPERSRQLSEILKSKGIPHHLDVWGHDVDHDWPWWRIMLPYWLDKLLR